ncbi:MAG TPA: MarR family winged helix-turn-helix transcriptional regulator [Solirubrobacteraceae bacterium]|nr:MarR family winged helix-turn-helix transcriptional regulator [Solirubrobacteraceae bacterium]
MASHDEVPLPDLMRGARDAYRDAVRRALADAGCDDIPRNGAFVLSGLAAFESDFSPQADVVASLGLSKQGASQLIDALVLRGYVERRIDPEDRRRMGVRLTPRGRRAATAIRAAIDEVEAAVTELITADQLQALRAGLAAFTEIGAQPHN